MNWAYALLELTPDADERSVKRAYAKRLRITRPDDDPAAFQQLHEAYKAALEWAQYRLQWEEETEQEAPAQIEAPASDAAQMQDSAPTPAAQDPGTDQSTSLSELHDPVELTGSSPLALAEVRAKAQAPRELPERDPTAATNSPVTGVQLPELPASAALLDADAMIRFILGQALSTEPARFEAWLQERPELWSLREKPRIGALLALHLFNHDVPMRMENFDVLVRCFRWDEVDDGIDPLQVQQCRQRLHRNWMLQPDGAGDLARHLRDYGRQVTAGDARSELQRLTRPWRTWQALWSAVPPWRTAQVNRLLERLDISRGSHLPAPLQPAQVAFWSGLRDYSRPSAARTQLALLQGLLLGLGFLLLMVACWALLGLFTPADNNMVRLPGALRIGVYGGGILLAVRALIPSLREMMRWISADEQPPPAYPFLHRWLIPVLGVGSVLLIHLAHARLAGSILAWVTLMLAAWRHWRRGRHVYRWKMPLNIWFLAIVLLGGMTIQLLRFLFAFGELVAALALVFWVRDSWLRLRGRANASNTTAAH